MNVLQKDDAFVGKLKSTFFLTIAEDPFQKAIAGVLVFLTVDQDQTGVFRLDAVCLGMFKDRSYKAAFAQAFIAFQQNRKRMRLVGDG